MQRLAAERLQRRLRFRPQIARARLEAGTVGHVAEQRVADVGEVHAHLVRAAGLERQLEQAGASASPARLRRIGLEHLVVGHGAAAAPRRATTAILVRLALLRASGASIAPRGRSGRAPDERPIAALELAVGAVGGELPASALMRGVRLGHHQQAGGVLVEPVHDAGPLDAADAREAVAAVGDAAR